jgi:RimJ/RimL family protein N-acetyltransferase
MRIHSEPNQLGEPIGFNVDGVTPHAALPAGRPAALKLLPGQLCRLEPLNAQTHSQDLFDAFALDTAGHLWSYLPTGPYHSVSEFASWATKAAALLDPFYFAILDDATGKAVGIASFLNINPNVGTIEVGWITFSPLIQRTPLATEAMYLMMHAAFGLGYRRYEWKCNALNQPSIDAAARLGFSFEGLFRQATIVKGHNRDTAWFSIIDSEWPAIQDALTTWLSPGNFDRAGIQRQRLSDLTAPLRQSNWPNLQVEIVANAKEPLPDPA